MTETNEDNYREKAISRYSSLFTLPSARKNYLLLSLQCILTGLLISILYFPSPQSFPIGLELGAAFLIATFIGNIVTCRFLLHGDLILDFRRTSFLSLVSNAIMSVFIMLDFLVSSIYDAASVQLKATSIGVFGSLALRFLVFQSVSFSSPFRIVASILLQPSLFLIPIFASGVFLLEPSGNILLRFGAAASAAFLSIHFLIKSLNSVGVRRVNIPSIDLFKAFLANWTEGIAEPLEGIFERLSEEHDIKISMIAFRSNSGIKAVIVVPGLHPGPFRNAGSSFIPSMIQEVLEKKFNCVVSVPHGVSGHELDLASNSENMRVLNRIIKAEFVEFKDQVSPFLRLKKGDVTANCQVFDKCAFIVLTLAPKTMEDLPLDLREQVAYEAEKRGFASAVTVDAHNSISGYFNAEEVKKPILNVVSSVLEKASEAPQSRFEVGAAKIVPSEFTLQDGMGPGGISIIVVKVNGQKTAYITIDGNNMVSGLREKILSEIRSLGVDHGEVMTTDTHAVNAVVINDLGYHPIGEAINHEDLIRYIKGGVKEALEDLEPAEVSWCEETVPKIRIIGEHQIENLCLIVDEVSRKTKKNSMILFPVFILLLALLVFSF